jgi:23S rRNA (adenine2030-N6)-methyltransferase
MNYRHAYHAGNFADILKHLVLFLCLDRLKQKDTPFFVLDAHAGCGVYDLKSAQAQKTKEYEGGVARVLSMTHKTPDLALFAAQLEKDFKRQRYPGSPMLIARLLRAQDRLLANELHPQDVETLKANMGGYKNVRVLQMDAYEAARAHLPPPERRGLVLIDPPFEIENNEFGVLAHQLKEWKKRWETGSYLIWYPEKAQQPVEPFFDALKESGFKEFWRATLELPAPAEPEKAGKLLKTGIVLINPPYQVPERFQALQAELESALKGRVWQQITTI